MTILTTKPCMNPFYLDNRQIGSIIFYNDEGEEFRIGQGWFGNNNRCRSLEIKDIKIRRKIDFTRKENFVISDKNDKDWNGFSRYKLYLYIDNKNIELETSNYTENSSNGCLIYHHLNYDIKINGEKFNHTCINRIEKTSKQLYVEDKQKELKEYGINLSIYDLQTLLTHYDLVKK